MLMFEEKLMLMLNCLDGSMPNKMRACLLRLTTSLTSFHEYQTYYLPCFQAKIHVCLKPNCSLVMLLSYLKDPS